MNTLKLSPEQERELAQEFQYYKSLGIELRKIDETPKPLRTIKETLEKYGVVESDIDTVYMMSYDIARSIDYIRDYHSDHQFNIQILGHESTMVEEVQDSKIKQIPSPYRYTEHLNLIKLKNGKHIKTTASNSDIIDADVDYMLFVEPYHNGVDFGPAYETKLSEDATEYEKKSHDLLKAKLFIPNEETIKDLLTKFDVAA